MPESTRRTSARWRWVPPDTVALTAVPDAGRCRRRRSRPPEVHDRDAGERRRQHRHGQRRAAPAPAGIGSCSPRQLGDEAFAGPPLGFHAVGPAPFLLGGGVLEVPAHLGEQIVPAPPAGADEGRPDC